MSSAMFSPEKTYMRAQARHAVRLALLWLVPLGLVAMLVLAWQIDERAILSGCQPAKAKGLECLEGLKPSSETLELAGSGARLACQLHPVTREKAVLVPTLTERICIEARVQTRWDELTQIDERLFMPTYALLSLLVAAWIALQPSAGEPATPLSSPCLKRRRVVAAVGIVVTTLVLLTLDALENSRAMAVLMDAERGPLMAPYYVALDAAAAAARQASVYKWAATAFWTAALAWGLIQWQELIHRKQRWLRGTAIATYSAAAITLAATAGFAGLSSELAGPVRGVHAGFVLAFVAMISTWLAIWATPTASASGEGNDGSTPHKNDKRYAREAFAPSLTADDRVFHLEEYRQLRTEVVGLLTRVEMLFRAAILVAATAFAWLVTNSLGVQPDHATTCLKLPRELLWFAWLIPPAFVVCAGMMAFVTHRRITEMGGYLHQLERALGCSEMGWEAYLKRKSTVLVPMTQRLWWLLLLLTIAATLVALIAVEQAVNGCPTK